MCAVPIDGLHMDDVTRPQLLQIQRLLKQRIPTGEVSTLVLLCVNASLLSPVCSSVLPQRIESTQTSRKCLQWHRCAVQHVKCGCTSSAADRMPKPHLCVKLAAASS